MDCEVSMDDYDQNKEMVMVMPASSLVQAQAHSNNMSMVYSSMLESLVEKQRQEIDLFVQQRNNQLRKSIHQQSKNHLASTLQTLESRAASIIRKKDEELAMAKSHALQLQARRNKLQQEKDAWEKFAIEKEALAISLNSALQQLQSPCLSSTEGSKDEDQNDETSNNFCNVVRSKSNCCKICGVHDSCMLLLPCRHVCSCVVCEASIESCPICSRRKEASFEIFLAR